MAEDVHDPLAVFRFRLTAADALACERLPGEWTGWQKVALILPLMAIGALAGLLEDWSGIWWWTTVGGLLFLWAAIWLVVANWRMHRRARAKATREGPTVVEEWDDRLVIRSRAGTMTLGYGMIGKVVTGEHHVFVLYRGGAVIMPQRAFKSPEEMRIFGETVDSRSMAATD